MIFCTRSPASFKAAREERLKVSGNPSQYDDLEQFIREQELMREIIAASKLPFFEVDVSDGAINSATEKIADWLEKSGGLFLIN